MPDKSNCQLGAQTSALEALRGEDMTGKVAIVTGGNRGIGYHTVKALAYAGATVYMGCRSIKSGEEARKEILSNDELKGTIAVIQLDLADFGSIKEFAEQFKSKEKHLHYFILNAGVISQIKMYTQHNFEAEFGINHMGHFYLQSILVDIMKQQSFQSRIVIISSKLCTVVSMKRGLPFDDLNFRKRFFLPITAFGQSKLCNVYLAQELAERLKESKVLVYALHPGNINMEMYSCGTDPSTKFLERFICFPLTMFIHQYMLGHKWKTIDQGASTTIYACCAKELEGHSGSYLSDCQIQPAKPQFQKIEQQKKLWEVSETYVEEVLKNGKISFQNENENEKENENLLYI